jgi:hypothetical protein
VCIYDYGFEANDFFSLYEINVFVFQLLWRPATHFNINATNLHQDFIKYFIEMWVGDLPTQESLENSQRKNLCKSDQWQTKILRKYIQVSNRFKVSTDYHRN